METYAFANQKGGVGKTTVTLGLAAALASQKVSALLVDLDPQASATKVLGVEVEERHCVADLATAASLQGPQAPPPRRSFREKARASAGLLSYTERLQAG
jgi:cellulose biosynthesis protein BcsQ